MKIIMISGKSASGKDLFASYLKGLLEYKGNRVLIIHFGDLVKYFASRYYQWDGNKDEAGRALLQHLGTTIMRTKYPTYWAKVVAKFISATNVDWDYVIIPDLRFENELKTVQKYNDNVITVRIDRYDLDGQPHLNSNMTEAQHNHISECALDDYPFDWYILNDGLEDDLRDATVDFLEEINA